MRSGRGDDRRIRSDCQAVGNLHSLLSENPELGQERFTGRLQLTWVRVPGLGDNALSLEGRIDRLDLQDPVDDTTVEGSVELSIGQRFGPH